MINVTLKIKQIGSEYAVLWVEDGKVDEGKTYYTDCKQDAYETRDAMITAYNETLLTNVTITKE